ncbi:MAG: DUF4175 family protein [Bacteroidota bacterium]
MAKKDNYRLLVEKLDQFIRKYYINQLIRGALYSVGLILLLFLAMNLLEHQFYFKTGMRKLLFFSFLGVSAAALAGWVLLPLTRYFRLGAVISHEKAAEIIGSHFGDVKDKLLNVLQLKHQSDQVDQRALILASINQKSEEIKVVPFKKAIDLSKNRKYLRYALPPLLLLLFILIAAPRVITDSTNRLINNSKEFEKPAPFSFSLEQEDLSVIQFEDFPISVKVEGTQLPNEVFIEVDNYQYRLNKDAKNKFSYTFSNVQKETEFRIFSSSISSESFTLDVLKKPNVLGFEVDLDYPAYTLRKDEKLESIGDLVVPVGTNIDWVFNAQNTDAIAIRFAEKEEEPIKRFADELFTYKKRALSNAPYKLFISNEQLPNADSISYSITVIPDLYPTIKAEKFQDSTENKLLFFVGEASDDYGLRRLSFNYQIKKASGKQAEPVVLPLGKVENRQAQFEHTFDMNELALEPGDEVSYYFEIYDNDGVNGSKSARTAPMLFAMPTVDEFEQMEEENDQKIKDNLMNALKESKDIQQEMKKMREKLLQEKELDWQDKKELEKLLERQKNLENKIEEAKQAYEENLQNQEEFSETEEQIMEKQEQLQELFEEVMSEEMQELMEKIEELMQELEKDEALEMMEDFEMNDEELEMELDRMLEMMKQLELEKEMTDAIEKMEELAEKQEELSEETEKGEKEQEELQKDQEEINEEFEDLKEKMDEMEKKNEELENPKDMPDRDEQMEDIQEDLNDSQEQLDQQQNSKASESQKKASQKMKDMAAAMQMQMQSGEMEQMEEDMASLRQLLENLVGLSFDQEGLIDNFGVTNVNTPRYTELVQDQFKLKDDFRLVEDSLHALSKRVFQIESFVTEKVTEIKSNIRESLEDLEERKKPQASEHQQRTMTNVNDLALMLSEVMAQMQQQMGGMMPGAQMCNNPGNNQSGKNGQKPGDKISQGQDGLNEQMKKMKEGLEKGMGGSSKEFAQMAAKQAALRKALREKSKKLKEQGKGSQELEDLIEQMDKVETDLVNKKLTNEMLKRQEEILTRLLQHEKAERQRELDQKRKAEVGSQKERALPPSMEEYIKKRKAEVEMYKSVSPSLKPYYKFLVDEYFKNLKSES